MALSERAADFLKRQKWRVDAVKSPDVIERAFMRAGRTLTPALYDFQMRYGGLMIYAGLEPICFGILHGNLARGDFQRQQPQQLMSWEPDQDCPFWSFTCADTLYQENFTLDENGGYYEGGQQSASSFDVVIEDLALFEWLHASGYQRVYSRYAEELSLPDNTLSETFALRSFPDFPTDIIYWGLNQEFVVRCSVDMLIVFALNDNALDSAVTASLDALIAAHSFDLAAVRRRDYQEWVRLQPQLTWSMKFRQWFERLMA